MPARPVADTTSPSAIVSPRLRTSALRPSKIAKAVCPRAWMEPKPCIVLGESIRTSWKNRGTKGDAILNATAVPVKNRRRVTSGKDFGTSSLYARASFGDDGCVRIQNRTTVDIVNNPKDRRKIPRIEIQVRRRPPTAGENTKPRGAEAQTTPKLDPVLFLSLAPAM